MTNSKNVQDIHRLTDVQELLLLHHLSNEGSDAGLIQVRGTLDGNVFTSRLHKAWDQTMKEHPILRSSVQWEGLKHPAIVVFQAATLEIEEVELGHLVRVEREIQMEERAAHLRRNGLDLTKTPPMRFVLLRLGPNESHFIWMCHHLLLDGWSSATVLATLLANYNTAESKENKGQVPSPSFARYAIWARAKDQTQAKAFWKARQLPAPPPLARSTRSSSGSAPDSQILPLELSSLPASRVTEWTRNNSITANCLFTGAWALALMVETGVSRPVFGITLSGRSVDFEGIESMVGMFSNTLPLAVDVNAEDKIGDWLRSVLALQQETQQYEFCSLSQVARWTEASPSTPLFNTLIAYTNFPSPKHKTDADALAIRDLQSDIASTAPLVVGILPGDVYSLRIRFQPGEISQHQVNALLDLYKTILGRLLESECKVIGDVLPKVLPSAPRPQTEISTPAKRKPGQFLKNQVEVQLAEMWSNVLGIDDIRREDNFFELGGTSLQVSELLEKIHATGVALPINTLFHAPTLADLASRYRAEDEHPSWPSLVTVRRGTGRPIYLVHAISGTVTPVFRLAPSLKTTRPIFGLQAPVRPQTDLVKIAGNYLEEIRKHQPDGPYCLGGICIGGCIAFEMARQLNALGEKLEPLVLIDSLPPKYSVLEVDMAPFSKMQIKLLGARFKRSFQKGRLLKAARRKLRLPSGERNGNESSDSDLEQWIREQKLPKSFSIKGPFREARAKHFCALRDYHPSEYSGAAWVIRTRDKRFENDLGWGEIIRGSITVETLGGHHLALFGRDGFEEIGARLTELLDPAAQKDHLQ